MKIRQIIVVSFLCIVLNACKNETKTTRELKTSSALKIDHLNIWVNNPKTAKQKLIDAGFTAEPDSLSAIHYGQGTSGRYFRFLNGYLELIFIHKQQEFLQNNTQNPNLDFAERANFKENGALPFSIALKLKEYNVNYIPFQSVKYQQKWMGSNNAIYAAKSSKTNLQEPSVFVVYPEIESDTFKSISDLESFPTENDFWKAFFKHPNGAEKITHVTITSTDINLNSKTIKSLNHLKEVTIKHGKNYLLELFFDNNTQNKTIDLRPELPIIVYL